MREDEDWNVFDFNSDESDALAPAYEAWDEWCELLGRPHEGSLMTPERRAEFLRVAWDSGCVPLVKRILAANKRRLAWSRAMYRLGPEGRA